MCRPCSPSIWGCDAQTAKCTVWSFCLLLMYATPCSVSARWCDNCFSMLSIPLATYAMNWSTHFYSASKLLFVFESMHCHPWKLANKAEMHALCIEKLIRAQQHNKEHWLQLLFFVNMLFLHFFLFTTSYWCVNWCIYFSSGSKLSFYTPRIALPRIIVDWMEDMQYSK